MFPSIDWRTTVARRIKQLGMHLVFIVFSNAIYGVILFSLTTWLLGFSLVYAYLGNLLLIIAGLVLDRFSLSTMEPKRLAEDLRKIENEGAGSRVVWFLLTSFVSFKAILYLFYMIILVVTQVAAFNPGLVSESVASFLLINQYSLVLLIALDGFSTHFSKDRKKMAETTAELKEYLSESQE